MKIWKTLSTEIVSQNPYWKYVHDTFEIPDVTKGDYHYIQTPGAVVVIPIDHEGKMMCVRQYRYLAKKMSLEFPGGGIKIEQTPHDAARAELTEEGHVLADHLEQVAIFHPLLGLVKETVYVFVATGLHKVDDFHQDDTEEFEDARLTPEEWEQAIASEQVINGFVLSAWAVARSHVLQIVDEIRENP